MKKKIMYVCLCFLIIFITGCGSNKEENQLVGTYCYEELGSLNDHANVFHYYIQVGDERITLYDDGACSIKPNRISDDNVMCSYHIANNKLKVVEDETGDVKEYEITEDNKLRGTISNEVLKKCEN